MTYPTSTCTSANDQSHVIESGFERTNPPLHDDQVNERMGINYRCQGSSCYTLHSYISCPTFRKKCHYRTLLNMFHDILALICYFHSHEIYELQLISRKICLGSEFRATMKNPRDPQDDRCLSEEERRLSPVDSIIATCFTDTFNTKVDLCPPARKDIEALGKLMLRTFLSVSLGVCEEAVEVIPEDIQSLLLESCIPQEIVNLILACLNEEHKTCQIFHTLSAGLCNCLKSDWADSTIFF